MTADGSNRPVPVADEETAGFWAAASRGELAFQRCQHCGHYAHPPVRFCVACHQLDQPAFEFEPIDPHGTIVSWTVIREHLVSGFAGEAPLIHALVELDVQPNLDFYANLVGDAEGLAIGAPVEVLFQEVADGVRLPCFRLRPTP